MALAYAIHQIITKDGAIAPKSVVDLPDAIFAECEKVKAIRKPTEDEIAFYEMKAPKAATPEPVAPTAPEQTATTEPVASQTAAPSDDRAKLEAEAKELGVKFQKNTSDEKLAERVTEAKDAAAKAAAASTGDTDLLAQ